MACVAVGGGFHWCQVNRVGQSGPRRHGGRVGSQIAEGGWVCRHGQRRRLGERSWEVGRRRSNRQASMRPTFKILGAMGGGASTNQVMRGPRRSWRQGPIFRAVQGCAWGATLTMTSTFFPHPTWPTSLTLLGAALHSCDCFICLVEKRFSQGFSTLGSPPSNLAQTDAAFLVEKDRQGLMKMAMSKHHSPHRHSTRLTTANTIQHWFVC